MTMNQEQSSITDKEEPKDLAGSREALEVSEREKVSTTQISETSATILENHAPEKTSSEPEPIPFEQLGAYEVLEELGRGGMGVVYKARHKDLDRTVALKVLNSHSSPSQDAVDRFLTEGKIAAKLDDHENIARVLDCGRVDGYSYLAMEFVDGCTFSDLIRRESVSLSEGLEIIISVASALEYAHRKGVIHRDLKPENVLIDKAGKALLTDFGVAKRLHDSKATVTGAIMGTLHFMAPEQAEDASRIDERSDVYGLGAMLYNLLTGRPPHTGQSAPSVLASLLTREPPKPRSLNDQISPALEELCMKALSRKPEGRFQSIEDMRKSLELCLSVPVEPSGAVPISPVKSAPASERPPTEDVIEKEVPKSESKSLFFVIAGVIGLLVFILVTQFHWDTPQNQELGSKSGARDKEEGPKKKYAQTGKEPLKPSSGASESLLILHDLKAWDRASPADQDKAIEQVAKQLGDAFQFVETKTFKTQRKVKGELQRVSRRIGVFRHKKLAMDFHLIPGGSCFIGTKDGPSELNYCQRFDEENWGRADIATELPRVKVRFAPLLVARTETSQRAWDLYRGKDQRSFKDPSYPIEGIEWPDLGKWLHKVGDGLRLPSEFEWEYACRAGSETRYYWGMEMDENQCHYAKNSGERPLPVLNTSKGHNAFGLIHMTGNVREWCQDTYRDDYHIGPFTPEPFIDNSEFRTQKGGGYEDNLPECRAAARNGEYDDGIFRDVGFRIFRSIKTKR